LRFRRPVASATVFPVALAAGVPRTAFGPVRTAVAVTGGMFATRGVVAMRTIATPRTAPVVGPIGSAAFAAAAMRPITKRAFTWRTLALRTCF
jgi:hypothetical protein